MEISFKQKSHNPVDKKEGQKKDKVDCLFVFLFLRWFLYLFNRFKMWKHLFYKYILQQPLKSSLLGNSWYTKNVNGLPKLLQQNTITQWWY